MSRFLFAAALLIIGCSSQAADEEFNPEQFALDYLDAWNATQAPGATAANLERYLSFLVEDVAGQHIPFDTDDTRQPDGKQRLREGMTYYLGKHIEYQARLIGVVYGLDAVAIQFEVSLKARRDPNQPIVSMTYNALEVLEIENGKVSVIRKYH
jgi:hypothetical protein